MATDCVTWMRHFVCGLHGHDNLLQFEKGRLSLRCVSCGHETPGWDLRKAGAADAPAAPVAGAHAHPHPRRRFLPQLTS